MSPHILVVEDHAPLREIISDTLLDAGFEITAAEDGQAALQALQLHTPDLIVSDIMMPRMDGYEFHSAVQANPAWVAIPFIFLTAKAERDDILRGKRLGVEEYLIKPFDAETLIVTVQARLQRAQVVRERLQTDLEQLKSKIMVLLSHELRTPLTYVYGYTELALEGADAAHAGKLQGFLGLIKHGVDRLVRLIEDLLLLIELEAGDKQAECQQNIQVCADPAALIRGLIAVQQREAKAQGVQLSFYAPPKLPPVMLCESFLLQAVRRLLDNAIKFTAQQAAPQATVTLSCDADWFYIAIADNGIGIPSEALPHLFESFYQVDRETLEQQGAGLGLPISAALIRAQGGKITVASAPGSGSTFTIQLPLKRS